MARKAGGSLRAYVMTRIALSIPMLLILLTFTFIMLRVAPGDPIEASLGPNVPSEVIQQIKHARGLDRPMYQQYFEYLGQTAHGDFGTSIVREVPVARYITQHFPATLELTMYAMLIAVVVGVGVGTIAGRFRDTPIDFGGRLFGIVAYSAPIFWLGLMLQLLFSRNLGWLPSGGRIASFMDPRPLHTGLYTIDAIWNGQWESLYWALKYLTLPAVTLGLVIGGVFVRLTRVHLLQTLQADYVEAARARGVRERWVVYRHAFKNALVPVVTIVGLEFALLLGGAVLTETTFTWPGLGKALVDNLQLRDYPVVQGIITFFALLVVGVSLLIDVVNAYIDPRIRY
ncbi:MAG: ABC transporter permease [Actinomycetota bacterium]